MTAPTYDQFIEPLLRFLARQSAGVAARQAHEAAALTLEISEADRQELLASGAQLYSPAHGQAGMTQALKLSTWRCAR